MVIIKGAALEGMKIRVSGQRHSQAPLFIADNRGETTPRSDTYLVDMSCYRDLHENGSISDDGNKNMVMLEDVVHVNAGVREDELVEFLTMNNKILKTATAGGFFSIGGMTSVDVHGCTLEEPIFAETATEYNFIDADGNPFTISTDSPCFEEIFRPIQFARVNVGTLGVAQHFKICRGFWGRFDQRFNEIKPQISHKPIILIDLK